MSYDNLVFHSHHIYNPQWYYMKCAKICTARKCLASQYIYFEHKNCCAVHFPAFQKILYMRKNMMQVKIKTKEVQIK